MRSPAQKTTLEESPVFGAVAIFDGIFGVPGALGVGIFFDGVLGLPGVLGLSGVLGISSVFVTV